jgi:hypothetical protein
MERNDIVVLTATYLGRAKKNDALGSNKKIVWTKRGFPDV